MANYTPLHWVGGKGKLVDTILAEIAIPDEYVYCEPFLGAGAMYYHLVTTRPPQAAYAADTCQPLRLFHRVLNDTPQHLRAVFETLCQDHPPFVVNPATERLLYYDVRQKYNERRAGVYGGPEWEVRVAAEFLYVNRFGHNGLYRENKSGGCNVPAGSAGKKEDQYRKTKAAVLARLEAYQPVPQPASYRKWEDAVNAATSLAKMAGLPLVVYLDPPYLNTFTGYGQQWSDPESTQQLIDTCQRAVLPAGSVIGMSNSPDVETLLDLPKWPEVHYLSRSGTMNRDAANRGKVKEVLAIRRF